MNLIEIAKKLGEHYEELSAGNFALWQNGQDQAQQKVAIVPAGGWPGKNPEQRKQAEKEAELADEVLTELRDTERGLKYDIALREGEIAALEAERRAIEWEIRREQKDALREYGIQRNTRAPEGSDAHLFDDVMQSVADEMQF